MSGIFGIVYPNRMHSVIPETMAAMRSAIVHRGPDGGDIWIARGIGFGYCRLAIEGNKCWAATAADGNIHLVIDGQIYNSQELKADLSYLGSHIERCTPAELAAAAYQEFGASFLARLNGMFSLALHDSQRGTTLLARDPLGIRPLFYTITDDKALFFGSEIKAILAGTGRRGTMSHAALQEFLIFRYIAGERTFFDHVYRIPPGHYALLKGGELRLSRYWTPPPFIGSQRTNVANAAAVLHGNLTEAVKAQSVLEAPLGAFCSGGIDSGMITGYAVSAREERLPTFSAGFHSPKWDETALANSTAARFGTSHQVLFIGPEEFSTVLPKLIWQNDEPLGHPNAVAIFLLSRIARNLVAAILAGDGADELLGGYPRYHIARLRGALDTLPIWATRALSMVARRIPGHRPALLAQLLPLSLEDSLIYNSAFVSPVQVSILTGAPLTEALDERRRLLGEMLVPRDPIASISRYELMSYLGSSLDRLDRMTMANGLESRLPFLDLRFVEWACRLNSSHKLRGTRNKYVLRQVAAGMLDTKVVNGRKSGFGIPLAEWLREPAFSSLVERLRDYTHPAAIMVEHQELERVLREHSAGVADHSEILWLLINVYIWHEIHMP